MKGCNLATLTIILFSTFRPSFIAISRVLHKLLAIIWNHLTNIHLKPHKMCKNVNVNNFLSTKGNYLKLSTITYNDILFPTVPLFLRRFTMTSFCDVMTDFLIFWELCQIWRVILAEIFVTWWKPANMLIYVVLAFRICKHNLNIMIIALPFVFWREHTF